MSWMPEERHHHPPPFIGHIILGLNDGIVTTLVFALSVAGAAPHSVVLAGLAEMFAGGVAMFLGASVASVSEQEAAHHQIAVERHEIEHEPEEERDELTAIYRRKGFHGEQLEGIVAHLTADKERWLNSLIHDELLLRPEEFLSPWKVGAVVGLSFILGALIPVLPFLLHLPHADVAAALLSLLALFGTGAAKSRTSHRGWLRSGLELVIMGAVGTLAGVLIGKLLSTRL